MVAQSGEQTVSAEGHRSRLLERYLKAGISSLGDYEILELLLTYALPRRDTKPIAKQLLVRYGSISAVLSAPIDELCKTGGIGMRTAAYFSLIKDTMEFCLNENFSKKPLLTHRSAIEEYLRFAYGHCRYEYAAVIFLDKSLRALGVEIAAEGTIDRTAIFPRKIIDRVIKHGAAAFIMAHNHPAGAHDPSEEDWNMTERLIKAGKYLDIRLVDHLIISKDKIVSMKEFERWDNFLVD